MKKPALALVTAIGLLIVLVIVPLGLAGAADDLPLLFYLLSVGALALVLLIVRLQRLLPKARVPRSPAPEVASPIAQFERIRQAVSAATWAETHVYESLRPIVREIVAVKLAREHGVDLERSPAQAHAIVGDGYAWDLARPDRKPPPESGALGWSQGEIERLLNELEAL
jgi:hypothetical protein